MAKKRVEKWIPAARRALCEFKIESDGEIDEMFTGIILEFGAAIISGRLRSATAFFSQRGAASVDRRKVVSAAYYCISGEKWDAETVLEYVYENESPDLKEQFLDALAALRAAMHFFTIVNKEEHNE